MKSPKSTVLNPHSSLKTTKCTPGKCYLQWDRGEERKRKSYARQGEQLTEAWGEKHWAGQNGDIFHQNNAKTRTVWNSNPGISKRGKGDKLPICTKAKFTFSTSQKVITRPLGFQNGVGLLCTTACCGRDRCGERERELQRQTRASSRREIGIRHETGRATSSSLQRKWAGEASKQLHQWSPCSPEAAATHPGHERAMTVRRLQLDFSHLASQWHVLAYRLITQLLLFLFPLPLFISFHHHSLSGGGEAEPTWTCSQWLARRGERSHGRTGDLSLRCK